MIYSMYNEVVLTRENISISFFSSSYKFSRIEHDAVRNF